VAKDIKMYLIKMDVDIYKRMEKQVKRFSTTVSEYTRRALVERIEIDETWGGRQNGKTKRQP